MCGPRCSKIYMYFATVCFVITGLITFVFGGLSFLAFCHEKVLNDGCPTAFKMSVPVIIFIMSIASAVFLTIIGCIAVCKNTFIFMKAFKLLVTVIAGIQIGLLIGLLAIGLNESTKNNVEKEVTETFEKNQTNRVDNIQQIIHCCGLKDSKYWGDNLPESCFPNKKKSEKKFENGCFISAPAYIKGAAILTAIVFVIDAIIKGFAVLAIIYIMKNDGGGSDTED